MKSNGYLLDGVPLSGTLEQFIADNDFEPEVAQAIRDLAPGQFMEGGGGAAPIWTLEHVAVHPGQMSLFGEPRCAIGCTLPEGHGGGCIDQDWTHHAGEVA
jgi:hypothetical protein